MSKNTIDEPTKKDVSDLVESQLYDIEAYGHAGKDSLIEGITVLLKRQHDYAQQALYQDLMALAETYDIDGSSSPDAPKTELAIPVESIIQYFGKENQ